jgi:hypothetical protein
MCAKSLNLLRNEANNFYQVGINLGDPIFRGVYHGKQAHDDDLNQVVQRALDVGCTKLMVTGSDLKESAHAIEIAKQFRKLRRCWRSASQLTRNLSWHLLRYSGRPPMFDKTI